MEIGADIQADLNYNKAPLGNLIRTSAEKMGVKVDDRFYGGAHTGVIK
jgi:hypothetical protein